MVILSLNSKFQVYVLPTKIIVEAVVRKVRQFNIQKKRKKRKMKKIKRKDPKIKKQNNKTPH